MSASCGYCRAPMIGPGLVGRPRPDRPATHYCCTGCLSLGERPDRDGGTAPLDPIWIRLAIGLLLAAQSMALGLAINLSPPAGAARLVLQGVILGATLIVAALLGGPLARAGLDAIRRPRITIEALFLTGIVGASCASLQSMIRGRGPIYFEVASVLLVIYSFGKALGARSRAQALASTRAWAGSLRQCRRLDGSGRSSPVDVATIRPGDRVEVLPGELIAVDGVVAEGVAFVHEAPMSGEAGAVVRRAGDRVWAGTAAVDARLVVRALASGNARRVDRLIEAVEQARLSPTSIQGQADRLARIFVPVVIAVALLTFAGWTWRAGAEDGLFNAMSVLLVACPCALGLATPIALWTVLNALAARGLVVRDGQLIERLAGVDRVVFDKTGTLTEDRFALIDVATTGDRARLLGWLAAVEAGSAHPIARGLARLAPPDPEARIEGHRMIPGAGIEAELRDGSGRLHALRVGRGEWLSRGEDDSDEAALLASLRGPEPDLRIYVEADERLAAIATLSERLRDSAADCLDLLRRLGLPVEVMTGDTPRRADGAGLTEARAAMSPDDKRQAITDQITDGHRPLFVGDGINDAPALAIAHAGIALASGTEIAIEAASATLDGDDLRTIPWAIGLCRSAVRSIRRIILVAAAYNAAGMALAASGRLHPVAAALLMSGSSLWVAWRASRVAEPDDCHEPVTERDAPARAPVRGIDVQAGIHAVALAAQGPILAALAGVGRIGSLGLSAAFFLAASLSSRLWRRREAIPHDLDMAYGMLTLGNLGMLAGWWADAGFGAAASGCGCGLPLDLAAIAAHPGMWLGMLLGGNVAMASLPRRPEPWHPGSWLASNLGMAVGMALGGASAEWLAAGPPALATTAAFVAMSLGMIGGMILGHKVASPSMLRHALCILLTPAHEPAVPPAGRGLSIAEGEVSDHGHQRQDRPRPARRGRGAVGDAGLAPQPAAD
jgi:heavy metal translocating P-type ATPase